MSCTVGPKAWRMQCEAKLIQGSWGSEESGECWTNAPLVKGWFDAELPPGNMVMMMDRVTCS